MVDNTKWLEPPDPAPWNGGPDDPERDVVWEIDITLTLDSDGMWVAQQGIQESSPYMYPEEAVKHLFERGLV